MTSVVDPYPASSTTKIHYAKNPENDAGAANAVGAHGLLGKTILSIGIRPIGACYSPIFHFRGLRNNGTETSDTARAGGILSASATR